jgi:hypothetical protein
MKVKKTIIIMGLVMLGLCLFYLTKLHEDNVIPFMKYKPDVDSLRLVNGSSLYYFARLDTEINMDTLNISVYGRMPFLILNRTKYNTFEKAHLKEIKVPENIKYIRFRNKLLSLDSIK